jgi:putative thioredoxin
MGAQTPSQIKDFIRKIIDGFGPKDDGLITAVESANEMLRVKDYSSATAAFRAIIIQDNNLIDAHEGLIKSLLSEKLVDDAKLASDEIPITLKNEPSIKTIIAQIQLSENTLSAGNLSDLREKFLEFPEDRSIKFDLALALIAEEETAEAIDTLLQIVEAESDWNGGKARSQIIELLDALGPKNENGRAGRRRLSSLIFS